MVARRPRSDGVNMAITAVQLITRSAGSHHVAEGRRPFTWSARTSALGSSGQTAVGVPAPQSANNK